MWRGDGNALWHIPPAVENVGSFYPTRPYTHNATDALCTKRGVRTKWCEEQNFSFPNCEHYLVLPAFLRNDLTFVFKSFTGSPVPGIFLPLETVWLQYYLWSSLQTICQEDR